MLKHKFLSLFVTLIATTALWASNTITYTATEDLSNEDYLIVGKTTFGPAITSHTFSNGTGTITCSGEITKIGGYAFNDCYGLTSVNIPNSVTTIGDRAFLYCTGLTSVTIPNSVTTIGSSAFRDCSGLTSVNIPNSVTTIGEGIFASCNNLMAISVDAANTHYVSMNGVLFNYAKDTLMQYPAGKKETTYTIPNSVITIGGSAFVGCYSLTSVTIPSSVTTIGSSAFESCYGLTSITIPNSVTTIGSNAFGSCSGLTSITIPNSVTTIERWAFASCHLTSITIPNSVTTIGDDAFYVCYDLTSINVDAGNTHYCSIDGVLFNYAKDTLIQYPIGNTRITYTIPNSVTTIGSNAFRSCNGLTSVTIPNSVTTIGSNAFEYVNNIVYGGTAIGSPWGAKCVNGFVDGYWVYSDATKTKLCGCSSATGAITIPNSVTTIGDDAFYGCRGLKYVTIPNSVTTIGSNAFGSCNGLTSVTIGNSVTTIGSNAFGSCSGLTSITIPNSVTTIGSFAFASCSGLTSITIPNYVTTIGIGAFYSCRGLTSVTIPSSVTAIGSNAFNKCTYLEKIVCEIEKPLAITDDVFSTYSGTLYVPAKGVNRYKLADVWKEFKTILPIQAEEIVVTKTQVDPSANIVSIAWRAVENAYNYIIVIKQGEDTICKMTFNAEGQLVTSQYYAPQRARLLTSTTDAEQTATGWRYVIRDLEPGTEYTYSIVAYDETDKAIDSQSGTFRTLLSSGLENLTIDKKVGNKFIYGNQLYLRRGDKIYNAAGVLVK